MCSLLEAPVGHLVIERGRGVGFNEEKYSIIGTYTICTYKTCTNAFFFRSEILGLVPYLPNCTLIV
jgi:hypothetical protein